MSKKLFAVALILSFAVLAFAAPQVVDGGEALPATDGLGTTPVEGGSVSWAYPPNAASGWYWMYDNLSSPPFSDPPVAALPGFVDISSGDPWAPYNDKPYEYQLPDSFWYYGSWYKPGDILYVSPDGWVSFDPAAEAGFSTPPSAIPPFPVTDAPNAVIAPLWQDMDPTQTPVPSDDNRVYHSYDAMQEQLYVQWYDTQGHANNHTYNFELALTLGGQMKLINQGACGIVFSYHFIHFFYQSSSHGWTADNGETGIENQSGEHGVYYQGTVANGRRIRAGYKRIFQHDVQAYVFLSPAETVLRWTEIQPIVVVRNIGNEVEHFPVTIDIFDEDDDSRVYHFSISINDLLPGATDTIVGPCWTPGELYAVPDTHSYRKVAYSMLDSDLCRHNDTLEVISKVGCDGMSGYHWNFADAYGWIGAYQWRLSTTYPANGGVSVIGGRIWLYECPEANYTYSRLEVWEANNGCGAVANGSYHTGWKNLDTRIAYEWNEVTFDAPIWVPAETPGNIWAAHTSANFGLWGGRLIGLGLNPWPDPMSCYLGPGPGRSGTWSAPDHGASWNFHWGMYYGYPNYNYFTYPIELCTHLGFSPMPEPPCYYDKPHDLTVYSMEEPSGEYVEAGVPITPELAIANRGLQAEPDADFFKVGFIAVDETTSDTVFNETSLMSGPLDMGDTTYGTTSPWTPEGLCDDTLPFVSYELIGYVLLGEVGPDLSDHCPYNDTVRRNVTCLLSHDVGVIAMTWPEEPDEEPNNYDEGSEITVTATVENFGFNAEHDVEVRLVVLDIDSNSVELWHALKSITFLDWRGNVTGDPYTIDVTFPTYDVLTNRHHQTLTCRTELVDDACPKDDAKVRHINTGIAETPAGLPFALEAITPNPFVGSTTISFAVPATVNVSLKVYDITGKLVTTLVSGNQAPGRHSVVWNGTDDLGRSVAQGIYLVRMDAASFSATKKIVLY